MASTFLDFFPVMLLVYIPNRSTFSMQDNGLLFRKRICEMPFLLGDMYRTHWGLVWNFIQSKANRELCCSVIQSVKQIRRKFCSCSLYPVPAFAKYIALLLCHTLLFSTPKSIKSRKLVLKSSNAGLTGAVHSPSNWSLVVTGCNVFLCLHMVSFK